MKKLFAILLCLLTVCTLVGCGAAIELSDGTAQISYHYGDLNIDEPLTAEEAAIVREILEKKHTYRDSATPSCSFSEEISITIGDQTFCIARDDCGILKLAGEENVYVNITDAQRDAIEAIFEAHGGSFPCV